MIFGIPKHKLDNRRETYFGDITIEEVFRLEDLRFSSSTELTKNMVFIEAGLKNIVAFSKTDTVIDIPSCNNPSIYVYPQYIPYFTLRIKRGGFKVLPREKIRIWRGFLE